MNSNFDFNEGTPTQSAIATLINYLFFFSIKTYSNHFQTFISNFVNLEVKGVLTTYTSRFTKKN